MQSTVPQQGKISWAEKWLKAEKPLYVDGKWQDGGSKELLESINPANKKNLGRFHHANKEDVEKACFAAKKAFVNDRWSKMPRRERGKLLNKVAQIIRDHHDELATLETLDNGKLYIEAYNDDIPESADLFDYYAGWTDKHYSETCPVEDGFLNYTVRKPVGVCALIVPWNFPLLMAMWKIAPALAMGNTVVLKPSPFTSFSLIRFFELMHEHEVFPPGVLNLVLGGADTGQYLSENELVDKVSFTGSTETGKKIVRSSADSNLKSVSLELGGKSPNIIFDDVPDLEFAIERSFGALFSHKGEKCSEPTRFFVHKKHYDYFLDELVKRAEKVVCGDPFDSKSTQGAQCNLEQFNKILRYIDIGKEEGGKIVVGGSADTSGSNKSGYFVRPTIFTDVKNSMKVSQDEIFGPVLVMIPFEDEEHVVELANDTIYGLAAGLWTSDVSRAHRVADRLDAGMIFINRYGMYDFASPFGGFKQSGWGKDMAVHSLDAYTKLKSIWLKL